MKVTVEIKEDYLIAHVLFSMGRYSSQEGLDNIVNFQNKAWEISQRAYNFLAGRLSFPEATLSNPLDNLSELVDEAKNLVKELKETPEYEQILRETQAYKSKVEEEWNNNLRNL